MPEIQTYFNGRIRHWHELVSVANTVRPMMGIAEDAWEEAKNRMGPEEASVSLAAMLERFEAIRSPGAYLRHLSRKATAGEFSTAPMLQALMRKEAA